MNDNELQTTLNEILQDKNTNLKPENLRAGTTCLGVKGVAELGNVSIEGYLSEEDYNTAIELCNKILTEPIEPTPKTQHIYGISRDRNTNSSEWKRTNDSKKMIANALFAGMTEVQNDFDKAYPWSEIKSYNYNTETDEIVAWYGDDNFTFSTKDTSNIVVMTRIPEFWYKRYIDDNSTEYIQIADYAAEGFTRVAPFSVGRYVTGTYNDQLVISNGVAPISGNVETFRNGLSQFNEKLYCMDIMAYCMIQILYLVEYANYNSQEKTGKGFVANSHNQGPNGSGSGDQYGMLSYADESSGWNTMIYRGMENIYGNICQFIDGIQFDGTSAIICTNPSKYTSGDISADGYVRSDVGISSGWTTNMTYTPYYSWLMLPWENFGGGNTYGLCDYAYTGSDTLYVGGCFMDNTSAGLFAMSSNSSYTTSAHYLGVRYMRREE
ncbi:MAG: hypothetical protein K2P14_10270 [Anaeroplasmataceae bacterium]|nr:hypothetical protein [Anaeroplasmataceae bacterium]